MVFLLQFIQHMNASQQQKLFIKLLSCGFLTGLLICWSPRLSWADEIDVSNQETGAGSENQANAEINQTTTIEMTNQSTTVNEINLQVNTGNNQANNNTGDSQTSTGDINTGTKVETSGSNNQLDLSNQVNQNTVTVTNQQTGDQSENQATVEINSGLNVTMDNQQATLNQSYIQANTGNNQANKNNGDVTINTGDVVVKNKFQTTTGINQLQLSSCQQCGGGVSLQVSNEKTGAESQNQTSVKINNQQVINQSSQQTTINQVSGDLNTGDNQADENNGEVTIDTGEIAVNTEVITTGNENEVILKECDPDDPSDPAVGGPDDPDDPHDPQSGLPATNHNSDGGSSSSNSSSSGSGSSSGSSVQAIGGQVLGAILPLTGSTQTLTLWMIGLFLISMGRFVRLLSGRAPAYAVA